MIKASIAQNFDSEDLNDIFDFVVKNINEDIQMRDENGDKVFPWGAVVGSLLKCIRGNSTFTCGEYYTVADVEPSALGSNMFFTVLDDRLQPQFVDHKMFSRQSKRAVFILTNHISQIPQGHRLICTIGNEKYQKGDLFEVTGFSRNTNDYCIDWDEILTLDCIGTYETTRNYETKARFGMYLGDRV